MRYRTRANTDAQRFASCARLDWRANVSRFREPQHPDFQRLNASIGFDRRLWPQDVAQSRAHARMLAAQGIIDDAERDALLAGLDEVERELAEDRFAFNDDDEDIHMAVERRLTELAGPVGGKLHTARSRNAYAGWGVTLYLLGVILAVQVAQLAQPVSH